MDNITWKKLIFIAVVIAAVLLYAGHVIGAYTYYGAGGDQTFTSVTTSGAITCGGELSVKVYSQDAEPTLTADNYLAVWIDTNDSNKTYLLFRRGSGDHTKIELQ